MSLRPHTWPSLTTTSCHPNPFRRWHHVTRTLPDDYVTWPEHFPTTFRTLSEDITNPFRRCLEPFPKISEPLPSNFRRSPEDVPTMSRDPPLMTCNFNEMCNPTANHSGPFGQKERIRLLIRNVNSVKNTSVTRSANKNINDKFCLPVLAVALNE